MNSSRGGDQQQYPRRVRVEGGGGRAVEGGCEWNLRAAVRMPGSTPRPRAPEAVGQ